MNSGQEQQASHGTSSVTTIETENTTEAPVYRIQLRPRPHVRFDESVIDNEHLGRKKSKSK